eukprot:491068_1
MGISFSLTKKDKKTGKEVPIDPEKAFQAIPKKGLAMQVDGVTPEWRRQIPMPLCAHQLSAGSKSIDSNCYHEFELDAAIRYFQTTRDLGNKHIWDYIFMVDGKFRMFDTNLITSAWKSLPGYSDTTSHPDAMWNPKAHKIFMEPGHTSMLNDNEYRLCLKDETSVVLYAGNVHATQDGAFDYLDNFSGHISPFGEEGEKVAVALGMPKSKFHRAHAKVEYEDMYRQWSPKSINSHDHHSYSHAALGDYNSHGRSSDYQLGEAQGGFYGTYNPHNIGYKSNGVHVYGNSQMVDTEIVIFGVVFVLLMMFIYCIFGFIGGVFVGHKTKIIQEKKDEYMPVDVQVH